MRIIRKLRYRKAYGVHSPFVYNLITKVVEEKTAYYAYEEVEQFRNVLLTKQDEAGRITAHETQTPAYGALLFRLALFFKSKNIIEIGSSTGVMGLYLAMADRSLSRCWLLEERQDLLHDLWLWAENHHLQNIRCIEGDYPQDLMQTIPYADLIFINQPSNRLSINDIIQLCTPLIRKDTLLILDGIHKNKAVKQYWQSLKTNPRTSVMLDLYHLGIVFFNPKLPKRYYKAYLKNGKKQSVHKNRGLRFYLFGRRKKSAKNSFPH